MSGSRSQPPPVLPGYTYKTFLGDGGFADVFLYEKAHPVLDVAIKVLRSGSLDAEARRAFEAEANLMARVSSHPFIVGVYDAGTADDGRPYLVMEYYSEPHYGKRAAEGNIAVADVLRLGVQISSAVEVAHREGIVHRDIKPANILVDQYGRPGLTDFGIAGSRAGEQAGQGWSVPYAPPEILKGDSDGDEASDVYSLAATLYAILAGRSPFARTGTRKPGDDLTSRVLNDPVPPIGRPDVPPALEHLLRQALSKDPASRPPSALSLAHSLQAVQRELRLGLTQIEVREAPPVRPTPAPDDIEGTRTGRPMVVRPIAEPAVSNGVVADRQLVTGPPRSVTPLADAPAAPLLLPVPERAPTADTVHRPTPVAPPASAPAEVILDAPARGSRPVVLAAGVVVALVAAAAVFIGMRGGGDDGTQPPVTADDSAEVFADHPASAASVMLKVSGTEAEVSWAHASRKQGDRYRITKVGAPNAAALAEVETSPTRVAYSGGCVQVVVVRGTRQSEPAIGCPP